MTNKIILSIQSAVIHGAVGNSAAMPIYQYLRQPAESLNTVQLAAHPGFDTRMLSVTPAAELDSMLTDYAKLDVFNHLKTIQTDLNRLKRLNASLEEILRVIKCENH